MRNIFFWLLFLDCAILSFHFFVPVNISCPPPFYVHHHPFCVLRCQLSVKRQISVAYRYRVKDDVCFTRFVFVFGMMSTSKTSNKTNKAVLCFLLKELFSCEAPKQHQARPGYLLDVSLAQSCRLYYTLFWLH
jgi:hypothetical protein